MWPILRRCAAILLLIWAGDTWHTGRGLSGDSPRPVVESGASDVRSTLARLSMPLSAEDRAALERFYEANAWSPAWLDSASRPTKAAFAALAMLRDAPLDGLDAFADEARALEHAVGPAGAATALDVDVRLSASLLAFLRALHVGRIDPSSLGLQLRSTVDPHDVATVLRLARSREDLPAAARDLSPPFAQYARLKAELARYRAFAADASLSLPLSFAGTVIHPGDPVPELDALCRLLTALGDLPTSRGCMPGGLYDADIQRGLVRYQMRHGLTADGIIGPATRAALRVPLAWRARQIAMAMERLRWVSDVGTERLVAVNIPMFRLWAWDSVPSAGPPALDIAVVVGRAAERATPIFRGQIERIVLRPYWNVPPSIVRDEMLPALERDAAYGERLMTEGFEVLAGPNDASAAPSVASLAQVVAGAGRLRQRPGPANALGLVKFVLPNSHDVYLHDTPAQALFGATRRDFSHGCIRVEQAETLAAWLLREAPDWTIDRIHAGATGTTTRQIPLRHPVPIVIFYTTAVVTPADGLMHFVPDLYGHDQRLDAVF